MLAKLIVITKEQEDKLLQQVAYFPYVESIS
jgi:hypothetical protein